MTILTNTFERLPTPLSYSVHGHLSDRAARRADARQAGRGAARRRRRSSTSRSGTASARSSFAAAASVFIQSRDLQAARSLLSRAARGAARGAARRLRDRRRDRHRHAAAASTSMRCSCGCTRRRRASPSWRKETPASFVAFDLLAVGRREICMEPPADASGARSSKRCSQTSSRRST